MGVSRHREEVNALAADFAPPFPVPPFVQVRGAARIVHGILDDLTGEERQSADADRGNLKAAVGGGMVRCREGNRWGSKGPEVARD